MPRLDPELTQYGYQIYSQNEEDGILGYLTSRLEGIPKFFVEIGVGPPESKALETAGLEANCRLLVERGWSGLFFDTAAYPPEYGVRQEHITALNVRSVFRRHDVPDRVGVLSIDVDGQDFWIWMNLATTADIVIIEYNANLFPSTSAAIPFDVDYRWDGTKWFGASLAALDKLGQSRDYVLVYANGVNAFFVRRELVENAADFSLERVYRYRDLHPADPHRRIWLKI